MKEEFTGERVIPGQVSDDLWAEHVARYAFASQLIEKKFGRWRLCEIERDDLDVNRLRPDFGGDLRKFVGAAGDKDEMVMVAGEDFGEFVSDAAGGAGDESIHEAILSGMMSAYTNPSRVTDCPDSIGMGSQNMGPA